MSQPPGYYGPPGGGGYDPYGQQPGGGYGGDPYGQPGGPPGGGYGDPYGQPSGPPGGGYGGDPYGQPSGPPGYGPPAGYGQPGYGPPGGGMPPPAFPPPTPKKSNVGLIVGIIGGLVALLCIGGAALVFLGGSIGATSTPEGAVTAFMKAAFDDRDFSEAEDYICDRWKDQSRRQYDNSFGDGSSTDNSSVKASWNNVRKVSETGSDAKVSVDVSVEYQGRSSSSTWTFELVDESGWKICDLDVGS
ncbi:MAG: hypothetical protein GEU94_13820 [Micromonosporaceae bacterium]|nr:hypothetical protein [Micromonosporaceae bacterium]